MRGVAVLQKAQPPTNPIDVRCVTEGRQFRSLRDEWQHLFMHCPDRTPFNSWEWLFSWWQAYGANRQLRILLISIDGRIAGIAPLFLGREAIAIHTQCRVLRFIGDGSFDSDHLGFLIDPAQQQCVLGQIAEWLRHNGEWDVLALREITGNSNFGALTHDLAVNLDVYFRRDESACAVLDLPRTFDEFLAARQSRFRTRLRSLVKKIDQGEIVFESQCAPSELRRKLRSLFELHQRRWNSAGQPGVFISSAKRLFYAHFVPRFARKGWLRLYSLRRGNDYVAHQLCFGIEGTTYLLQEGFDVSDPTASFGQMLRAAVIRQLIESGETRYDFLGGFSKHKEDWGTQQGKMVHVVLARKSLPGWLYFNAPAWRARLGTEVKRVLPMSVLQWLRRVGVA